MGMNVNTVADTLVSQNPLIFTPQEATLSAEWMHDTEESLRIVLTDYLTFSTTEEFLQLLITCLPETKLTR